MRQLLIELEQKGVERIVLYGATDLAEIAHLLLSDSQLYLAGIVDDTCIGTKLAGRTVAPINRLQTIEYDRILITSFEPKPIVIKKLKRAGISEEHIVTL